MASHTRVADRYLVKTASGMSINKFIENEWLPEVGQAIVSKLGGRYQVKFSRGYKLIVTTDREPLEIITLRVSTSYRSGSTAMHFDYTRGGESYAMDSLDYGTFSKWWPKKVGEWVVNQVGG